MKHPIGRIAFHAPDWKWVQLEDGHEQVEPGDVLRVRYHPAVDLRTGAIVVGAQDGARIYARDQVWFEGIPAIADTDYVYRIGNVESAA